MACEVVVKIKGKTKTLTKRTMVWEVITADYTDQKIDKLVAAATKEFGEDTQMKVTVTLKIIED